jgi:uncharacterized membrane protein YozB (DUF420 family)
MIEGARYIGDSFYCVAIVTGVLAIRKADAKKNKRVRIASLMLTAFDIFALFANHGAGLIVS